MRLQSHYLSIRRRAGILLLAACVCVIITGCKYTAAPADLLGQPPISQDKLSLLQAIEHELPAYSKLTVPLREDTLEAIRQVDLDGDGRKEAVVTYYNEFGSPEVLALKLVNASWKPLSYIQQSLGRQIDWMKLQDMDGDGHTELLLGWIGSYDSPKWVEVYSLKRQPILNEAGQEVLEPSASLPYSYVDTGDIDGDGKPELAVISETPSMIEYMPPSSKLSIYNWAQGRLELLTETSLERDVNGYERLVIGQVSAHHRGIAVEAGVGAHSSYTAMYAWMAERLKLVYPRTPDMNGGVTGRPTIVEDINKDGILEINQNIIINDHDNTIAYAESLWLNRWIQWDGREGFLPILREFSDYGNLFQLRIPDSWKDTFLIRKPEDERYGLAVFSYFNPDSKHQAEVITIYVVPQQAWDAVEGVWQKQTHPYHVLERASGLVYAVRKATSSPESLTEQEREQWEAMRMSDKELERAYQLREE
ncbi:FG-GAP-like repeat-containing protein [Paenibacillus sp. GCM10023252]|uniref:FG-GAP-like repeat-containing protein n=1 Tax=Paenibacillus sp. GCM10023252 TaxID=3252649 RepID=UPI003617B922